jgi:hypothetical protein
MGVPILHECWGGHKAGYNDERADPRSALNDWCERGDSNPHGFTRQILSLVRLPIPPLSHDLNYTKWRSSFELSNGAEVLEWTQERLPGRKEKEEEEICDDVSDSPTAASHARNEQAETAKPGELWSTLGPRVCLLVRHTATVRR